MKDQHIREYTERDWAKVAGSDRDHWVQRFRAEGPRATVEVSHALFEHARSARADFPGSRYVAADLGGTTVPVAAAEDVVAELERARTEATR